MTVSPWIKASQPARTVSAPQSSRRRRRPAARRGMAFRSVAAIVSSAILLFPLYWMVVVAFSPREELLTRDLRLWPAPFTLGNFDTVFSSFTVVTWFGNSVAIAIAIAIAVVVTGITVCVNLLSGYAFAHP